MSINKNPARKTCYLCGLSRFKQISDALRDGTRLPILKCLKCGLIFLDTTHVNFTGEKYRDGDYLSRNPQIYGYKSIDKYDRVRKDTYQAKAAEILPKLNAESEVLEIGCGSGSFLSLIKKHVKKAVGVEVNRLLADYARTKLNILVHTKPVESVELGQKFDAIFLFHVIEHLKDPLLVLRKLGKYLKKGGFMWIECPNTDEALMRFLPDTSLSKYILFNYHLSHLWYFNKRTLSALVSNAGFDYSVKSVHDYTFLNFLGWWFTGMPSKNLEIGQLEKGLYKEPSNMFMEEFNDFFSETDFKFKKILEKHYLGSSLACEAIARKG